MLVGIADTHAAIWYLYNDQRLSTMARSFIEASGADGDQIGLSSISVIEIIYLVEKGKIHPDTYNRLTKALNHQNAVLIDISVTLEIAQAVAQINRSQVPDMPDRIIAGTALHYNVPLISRDARIQDSQIKTIW